MEGGAGAAHGEGPELEAADHHGAHHHLGGEEHYRCLQCHMERPASDFMVGDGASGAWHQYCRGCMLYQEQAMQEQQMQHLLAAQVVDAADHAHVLAHHAQHAHAHHGGHPHPLVGAPPGPHALAAPTGVHLLPGSLLAQQAMPGGVHAPGPGFAPAMIYPEARQGLGAYAQPLPLPVAAAPAAAAAAAPSRRPLSKVCTKCRQQQPLSEFPELKGKKKGRSPQCSTCKAGAAEVVGKQEVGRKGALEEGGSAAASVDAAVAPSTRPARSEAAAGAAGPELGQQAGGDSEADGEEEGEGEELEEDPLSVTEKPCMHCGEVLPAAAFRRSKNKTDRLQNRCKGCEMSLGRGTKRDRTAAPVVRVAHKLCRRCGAHKDASLFFQSKLSLDGLCTYCKACQKDLNKLARAKRPEQPRDDVVMKECRHCHQARPAEMYFKSKMNLDGLYSYCKPCATVLNSASKKKRRAELREEKRVVAGAPPGSSAGASSTGSGAAGMATARPPEIRRPVFWVPPSEQAVFNAAAAAAVAAARAPPSVVAAAAAAAAAAALQVGQQRHRQQLLLQQAAALQAAQQAQQVAQAQQQRREEEEQQAQQQQQQQQQEQQAQYEPAEGYGGAAAGGPPPYSAAEQAQDDAAQQQYTEEQVAQYEAAAAQYGVEQGGGQYEVAGQQYSMYAASAEQYYIHTAQQYAGAHQQGAYAGAGGEGYGQQQQYGHYAAVTTGDPSHHHAQYHPGEMQFPVVPAAGPLTHEQLSAVLGQDLMAAVAVHPGAAAPSRPHGGPGPPYHMVFPPAGGYAEGHVAAAMQYYHQQQQQQVYAEEQHPEEGAPTDYQPMMLGQQQQRQQQQQEAAVRPPFR